MTRRVPARKVARILAEAANMIVRDIAEGSSGDETDVVGRLVGAMRYAMNGKTIQGVKWRAKTLSARNPIEEKEFGADLAGVLKLTLPGYRVDKGFLAQVKMLGPSGRMRQREFDRLRKQCDRMLMYSPVAYVLLCSAHGVYVVPALDVEASDKAAFSRMNKVPFRNFLADHVRCRIGDRRISTPDQEMLEGLRKDLQARNLLYLEGGGLDLPQKAD